MGPALRDAPACPAGAGSGGQSPSGEAGEAGEAGDKWAKAGAYTRSHFRST
jgi:hypothetical protein